MRLRGLWRRAFGPRLHCKVGDIVRVVGGDMRNFGRRLVIVAPDPRGEHAMWQCTTLQPLHAIGARTGREYIAPAGETVFGADELMRPVGDLGQRDETLTWAGLPQPTSTALPERVEA